MKTDLPKDLNPAHPVHPSLSSRAQALIDQAALDRKALEPLLSVPKTPEPSPIAAPLPVPGYTHTAMVELMVANPDWNHRKLAAHWGRNSSWFASVLASDAFQLELDKRRGEIVDPYITATMEERFRALTLSSLTVLQDKLDSKEVNDMTVLKAAEIGVKALGMGNIAPPPVAPSLTSIDSLADRLVSALEKQRKNVRTIDAAVVVVHDTSTPTPDPLEGL